LLMTAGLNFMLLFIFVCWQCVSCSYTHFCLARLQNCKKRPLASSCFHLSVRPAICTKQLCSHWTDFHETLCLIIFEKSVNEIQSFIKNLTRKTGTSHDTFFIIPRLILFRVRNVSHKTVEKIKTHVIFNFVSRKSRRL